MINGKMLVKISLVMSLVLLMALLVIPFVFSQPCNCWKAQTCGGTIQCDGSCSGPYPCHPNTGGSCFTDDNEQGTLQCSGQCTCDSRKDQNCQSSDGKQGRT